MDNQWFFEKDIPNTLKTFKVGIKIKEKIYSCKSNHQNIEIYNTESFGKMLVIDGIIQTTEKDEFIYHESIVHIPMIYHSNPKKILIIGGGDGGSLKELLKHKINEAYLVEIDDKVINACKKYMPSLSKGAFDNSKIKTIIADGSKFIKQYKKYFDVIILDLSDPFGPAENLISSSFYSDIKNALTDNGVISVQSGSLEFQTQEVKTIYKRLNNIFQSVKIHKLVVPTYQGAEFSITIAANFNLENIDLNAIKKKFKNLKIENLKYYTPEIHLSSSTLPLYLKNIIIEK